MTVDDATKLLAESEAAAQPDRLSGDPLREFRDYHTTTKVAELREALRLALAVVQAVQVWATYYYERDQHCDHDTLAAALAAFKAGGKP